jgi:hypothetical protein
MGCTRRYRAEPAGKVESPSNALQNLIRRRATGVRLRIFADARLFARIMVFPASSGE